MTTPSPILGGFGISRSSNASDSESANLFLEMIAGKDGRAPGWLQMAPGLKLRITVGTGPIRGLKVMAGFLYAVSGNAVYQIGPTLVSAAIGTISTSSGPVSMIQNGTQLAIFDGYSGWLTTAALALNGGAPLTGGTISDGGLNNAVGDNITLIGAQGQGDATAIITVTAISTGGIVTAFVIQQPGLFSSQPATFNQASTTGSGSGFVLSSPSFGASGGLSQINLPFSGGPISATYQDGFGVVNDSLSNYWYQSDLFDLSVWGALNFAQANSQPDNVKALADLNREVFIFKDDHTEVWINAGVAGFTFQRLEGVFIECGTNAPFSVALAGQSICFLAQNSQGGYEIRRIMGYEPKRISTHAVEQAIAKFPTVADAEAYSYSQDGHLFYVISFPSGDTTFCCDLTDSAMAGQPLWHKRASIESPITGDVDGKFHRHWGTCYSTWPSGSAQYQPKGILMQTPQKIETSAALLATPATFTTALFAGWFFIPDQAEPGGLWFGDQAADAAPGTGGVQIGIFNDASSAAGQQIVVNLFDSSGNPIVAATYAWTGWTGWIWIGISADITAQALQIYISDGRDAQPQTPTSIIWTSTNAIANTPGQVWHLAPAATVVPPTAIPGGSIAELVVPSDGYGTPSWSIVDWINGKVYLLNKPYPGAASIRSYLAELVTQNPIASAFLYSGSGGTWYSGDADPVTGDVLIQGSNTITQGGSNAFPIGKFDPTTLALISSFGGGGSFPSYPTSIWAGEALVCVGVGTLASGGATQVGYALVKEGEFSGYVAVIRTDTMTAVGAYLNVVTSGVNNRGLMCRGASGPFGGSVFLTPSDFTTEQPFTTLYTVAIAPGAETYDPSTWPATNPYISSATVGTIVASAIDPAWTTMLPAASIGYDSSDGNVLLDVSTSASVTNKRYIIKVNSTTAAVIWATPIGTVSDDLAACNVNGLVAALAGTSASVITTSTGALATTALTGLSSLSFTSSSDTKGLIFSKLTYVQGAGNPTPVAGTPTSFSGWAFISGVKEPTFSFSAAELFFSPTAAFFDLSVTTNRRKFLSASGGAWPLGTDGSAALGASPSVFLYVSGGGLSTTANTFAANNGVGGAFTITDPDLQLSASRPPGTQSIGQGGPNVVGDYRNGNIYSLDLDQPTDNGTQRRWLRRWRALAQPDPNPHRFVRLTIQMETGAQVPDGTAPLIELRWSDDGGHTWSNRMIAQAGPPGATAQRVFYTPLGSTRRNTGLDRIFELSSSSEFKVAITSAELEP